MAELPGAFAGVVLGDRYELNSVLGQGKSGMVFKARHRHLDRFVAVKLFSPEAVNDKTAFLRFEREAHSVGRLNHPNIVTVFDVGRWKNERPFLVMDFIDGMDLQDLMGKEGRLPLERGLRICTQVCSALHHAHKRGVIHRDLKPRNIMVIDDEDIHDFVKVVDFGIAKESEGSAHIREVLTLDGYVMGTPQYMSPEQCMAGKVDARTDVYALVTVLFKVLTGDYPVGGSSLPEIMNNQIHQKPLSFEEACPHVKIPPEIQRVIYKGLSKSPADRQESMAQLRAELTVAFDQCRAADGKPIISIFDSAPAPAKPTDVIDQLRERAMGGDAVAQLELVMRLEYGQGCAANPEEARRWLGLAAQQGMKEAQFRLADHYLRGEAGYEYDPDEAFAWMSRSAEQGYDSAEFTLGWCFEHGIGTAQDLRLATTWYQKAARQGNAQASEQLHGLVERLQEEPADSAESVAAPKEAESNDPETLFARASKLRDSGKPGDRTRAAVLFQQAAHLGHELAQLAYIKLLLADKLNPEGQEEAIDWLENQTAEKNQIAMLILAACLRNGIGCLRDLKRAQNLLEDLSKEPFNMSAAQATLGASLLTGDAFQRNIPRGIALLKQSAGSGDAYGQWKLAICLRNGIGVMKDAKSAELYFQKSAEASFPQGIDELWQPSTITFADAVQIFKALAAIGNTNAFYWLGICHENGLGVERDLKLALSNYEQAHSKGARAVERIKSMQA